MMRTFIAGSLALVLLAAGCGRDGQPAAGPGPKPGNGGSPPPKGGGPTVVMPDEAPRIVVEAETATEVQPHFKAIDESEASGGKCLTVPSKGCNGEHHQHIAREETDPERVKGSAELAFNVETAGDYYLWIRKWWCCSCGDSFSLQLDAGKPFVFGNDGTTPRHWTWLVHQESGEPLRFRLAAGAHKLVFRNRGESGFKIDQVLFAADPKFVPQGREQAPKGPAGG